MATTARAHLRGWVTPTPMKLGVTLIVVIVLAGWALFNKNRILTYFRSGETISIHFSAASGLVPYESEAKVSFVPVGVVTGVHREHDGSAVVDVKVSDGTRTKLGSDPSAVIRPTTLLGGNYFVDLEPGGDRSTFRGAIPLSRTAQPVELDNIAAALQPNALTGAQGGVANVDAALKAGTGSALDQLAADAPTSLAPTGRVLTALQGTQPDQDLTDAVAGLEATAQTLTAKQGQLDDIVSQLTTTSTVLGDRSQDVASTIASLPASLQSARTGLTALGVTLGKLDRTAQVAMPTAQQLNTTLEHLNPLLVTAAPVVSSLNSVLTNLEPTVQQLVPAAQGYTSVLGGLDDPVLPRVNGPVKKLLQNPYHGSGSYAGTGSDKPFYEELGYMFSTLDRASSLVDANGQAVAFDPGAGVASVGGLPISLEQMFTVLTNEMHLYSGAAGK